jgi:hypothetical protein
MPCCHWPHGATLTPTHLLPAEHSIDQLLPTCCHPRPQVLEFITSMTIAAHQQLLRRHTGLPATHQPHPAAPFGSSSSRAGGPAAPATNTAADDTLSVRDPALAAKGSRVDLSAARRILPTLPRRAPARAVPVYTVPRPDFRPDLTRADPVAIARTPRQQQQQTAQGLGGRLEPLEGWQTGADNEDAAGFAVQWLPPAATTSSAHKRCTPGEAAQALGTTVTTPSKGSDGRGPAKAAGTSIAGAQQGPQLGRSSSSIKSSESSWAG